MLKQLIEQMSSDLNIWRYESEAFVQFRNRLIYSAVASWAGFIVLDEPQEDLLIKDIKDTLFHSVSRRHLTVRLTKILGAFLETFALDKMLIADDADRKVSDIATQMVDDLIFTNVLIRTSNNRVTISEKSHVPLMGATLLLGYREGFQEDIFKVGCGDWCIGDEDSKVIEHGEPLQAAELYHDMVLNTAWCHRTDFDEGDYECFFVGSPKTYSKCWGTLNIRDQQGGISLIRERMNPKNYSLLKIEKGGIKTASIDQWYYNNEEIYRFEFMLNKQNNTPAEFFTKHYADYMELQCTTRLPAYERRILYLSSWPKGAWSNEYHRIIPSVLFPIVKNELDRLGVILKEKERK